MNGSLRLALVCGATLVLAACGPTRRSVLVQPPSRIVGAHVSSRGAGAPGASYRVVHGDTLYAIAFRNGVDFRNLAAWNAIAPPYTIRPGQLLRLAPSASAPLAHAGPAAMAGRAANSTASAAAVADTRRVTGAPVFEPVTPASKVAISNGNGTLPHGAQVVPTAPVVPVAGASDAGAHVPPPAIPSAGASRVAGGIHWRWPASGALIKRFQSGDAIPGIELAGKSGDPVLAAADGVVVYSGNGLVGYGELIIIKHNDSFLSAYGHNRKRLVKEGQRVSAGQQIAEMGSTGASRDELEFQVRLNGNPVDPLAYLPAR